MDIKTLVVVRTLFTVSMARSLRSEGGGACTCKPIVNSVVECHRVYYGLAKMARNAEETRCSRAVLGV